MKLYISGLSRSFGIAKVSQKPYEILVCHTLQPIESGTFGAMTVEAIGYREVEMRLTDASVIRQFDNVKLPGLFDVVIETKLDRGEYRSALSGLVQPVVKPS